MCRPCKYDLDKEADDLLTWSLRPDATSLYAFTDDKDYLAQELSYFAGRSDKFSLALSKAKERIGLRREIHCSAQTMDRAVWNRSAHMYDTMLDASEEAKKDRDAQRRKDIESKKQTNYTIVVPNDLAIGANLPAQTLPEKDNSSS